MTASERIYLDNAATSWPKPDTVYETTWRFLTDLGGSAGRSVYREAIEAERVVQKTRQSVARLLGLDQVNRIVFSTNGTDALNVAIHGMLDPGDHVITSMVEHNSVLRPLNEQSCRNQVEVTFVTVDHQGVIDPDQIASAIRANTKLIVVSHASNVTGVVQPIDIVGRIAREHGVIFLVDAAQTVGHVPIRLQGSDIDLLAASGHKGLLGPLGTGILYVGDRAESMLRTIRQGGTGTNSEEERQPRALPEKYEVGNMNIPAIAGLGAGIDFLLDRGIDSIRRREQQHMEILLNGLAGVSGISIFGNGDPDRQVPVVSFRMDGLDPQEVASVLDSTYRIQLRAGLHCAPRMHQWLGTGATGGTIRMSLGWSTTVEQIDMSVQALNEIASSLVL